MTRPARAHNPAGAAGRSPARLGTMNGDATLEEQTARLTAFRAYVRSESRDPRQNRDRYYDLLWQPTLFGAGALVRVWGRRGQSATTRVSTFPDRACAEKDVRQLVRTRLRHGYQVTDWY